MMSLSERTFDPALGGTQCGRLLQIGRIQGEMNPGSWSARVSKDAVA